MGLLSIGSEASKGNETTIAARALLEGAPVNFAGHAEGNDIFAGAFDVVVCDGFVGNIVLKFGEGMAESLFGAIRQHMSGVHEESQDELRCVLRKVHAALDYSEYGGAPLLGLKGACLVGHGRSSAKAIGNAIRTARNASLHALSEKIAASLQKLKT